MADDISGRSTDNNGGNGNTRLWGKLRHLIHFRLHGASLRDQIEDAIGDHEDDHVQTGEPGDDLTPDERQMVRNVLAVAECTVGDVAVPRSDIVAIAESASFDELVAAFVDAGHSRLPVYRSSLDEIVGMIHVKDVFNVLATDAPRPAAISELIREPRYVPASMGVIDLLEEMRRTRTHLAIVVDEYSGTDGLLTIEDLVEEIVGEIEDEYDEEAPALLVMGEDGSWEADARTPLEEIGERVDPALAEVEDDIDTVGGLAFMLAGRVPELGAELDHPSGWRITVMDGDERRITRVRLCRLADVAVGSDCDG
ncbi:hemolysin family protein [Aquisediminimonas sediminicola]|uniref:hemolysin family protein n=1 Tax=Alteraquisediminimonas sediminicola TaxID=2676787 RepID=UPI001C8EFF22|nr:hemolysin family protein [Aquisediminimonas sediminicola]